MSRIGKKPIPLPDKVSVTIKQQDVTVKGPKGELSCHCPSRYDGQAGRRRTDGGASQRPARSTGRCMA